MTLIIYKKKSDCVVRLEDDEFRAFVRCQTIYIPWSFNSRLKEDEKEKRKKIKQPKRIF